MWSFEGGWVGLSYFSVLSVALGLPVVRELMGGLSFLTVPNTRTHTHARTRTHARTQTCTRTLLDTHTHRSIFGGVFLWT